ncbi:MAG: TetR family transcriptional regulator [Alphaproteobacteria bacterium]|nr:MAG: TetR family transcriptional regulator [Alphaproteobacteria bacterium]
MAEAAKRGRRVRLTRERVVAEAVALADAEGLDALSMRRLAKRLGVEAMSLYNHVSGKEDLLGAMVDAVAGEIRRPAAQGEWKAEMRARAVSAHEVFLRHPWAPMLFVSRVNAGPKMLEWVDATIGCLRAAGFDLAMADHAWNAIDSHIYGFTLQELNFPFAKGEYAAQARAWLPHIPPDRLPNLHAMAEAVATGRHDGIHDFTFGLDLILDGLEALLTPPAQG